jgi:hypothetical protein
VRSATTRRSDQRLIHPARLRRLEELAAESKVVRVALSALRDQRYAAMEIVRIGPTGSVDVEQARGWLRCLDDLGAELLRCADLDGQAPAPRNR